MNASEANTVALAAQADLVLLTVDMLRSPQAFQEAGQWRWFDLPPEELQQLLRAALGSVADQACLTPEECVPQELDAVRTTPLSALADVQRCAKSIELEAWSDEYSRLFDGATACPLNQASYIRRDKGTILGDLSGFYHAFGWQRSLSLGERPDHLLCQLEFVGMLLASASRAPNSEAYEVVMQALSKYAREHMHDWLPSVCWQMCEQTRLEYFAAASQWLFVLWQSLTDLHAWPIDLLPEHHMQPITDPDNPYECGAPDLHQIEVN
ncbi:MAG: molecular chaperone TorD family protein [Pirellulaceae bacterium]|nr:molecular chaperone TorD family protein [Pirellulaceae bacterium]